MRRTYLSLKKTNGPALDMQRMYVERWSAIHICVFGGGRPLIRRSRATVFIQCWGFPPQFVWSRTWGALIFLETLYKSEPHSRTRKLRTANSFVRQDCRAEMVNRDTSTIAEVDGPTLTRKSTMMQATQPPQHKPRCSRGDNRFRIEKK